MLGGEGQGRLGWDLEEEGMGSECDGLGGLHLADRNGLDKEPMHLTLRLAENLSSLRNLLNCPEKWKFSYHTLGFLFSARMFPPSRFFLSVMFFVPFLPAVP